jgi:hypothetical protein
MPVQPETRLKTRIVEELEEQVGGTWKKIHGEEYQPFMLDLVGCVRGLYFELEVKVPGNKATKRQQDRIDEVREEGGVSDVVTSPQEAVKIVRRALARAKTRSRLRSR